MQIVTVRLPDELIERISNLREKVDGSSSMAVGTTRTDVLRAAILEGLAALERKHPR